MNIPERTELFHLLHGRHATLIARWFDALAGTACGQRGTADLRRRLRVLTDQLLTVLLCEPFAPEGARAIGAALSAECAADTTALAGTQVILLQHLLTGLPVAPVAALQPRLALVLSAVGAGFCEQMRDTLLAEQEAARWESEACFQAVFTNAPIGLALADLRRRVLLSNPALETLYGYSGAQLRRLRFPTITHPHDAPADMALFKELIAGRRDQYQLEKRYVRPDGQILRGRLTMVLLRDKAGAPRVVLGMVQDLTALRAAQDALDQMATSVQTFLESMAVNALLAARLERAGEVARTASQPPASTPATPKRAREQTEVAAERLTPRERQVAALLEDVGGCCLSVGQLLRWHGSSRSGQRPSSRFTLS